MPGKTRKMPVRGREWDALDQAGRLEVASSLGGTCILTIVSGVPLPDGQRVRGWLVNGDKRRRLTGSRMALSAAGSTQAPELLVLTGRANDLGLEGTLVLETSDGVNELQPTMSEAGTPVRQFGPDYLAKLDAPTRLALLEKITGLVRPRIRGSTDAAEGLRVLRDAVRPRLPLSATDPAANYAVNVDGLWRVTSSAFYVKGWLFDRRSHLDHLRLLTPEGCPIDLIGEVFRHPRLDVSEFFGCSPRERLGFIAYFETPEESLLSSGWILEAGSRGGSRIEVEVPDVIEDPTAVRTLLLQDLEVERLPDDTLRTKHIRPALARLEELRSDRIEIERVDQYGIPPANPEVTIVVPLYRQMAFLEHQLAQFVHDPEIREADLIYVLDSPEDADYVRALAETLVPLYGVPFRVATLSANGGFAVANNLGASLARGRMLLLLNSDILPDKPGWLSKMAEFYDSNPAVGALGPKLLYEDDSIQHAGLYFDRPPGSHVWSNEHYFKGLHRDFPKANVARDVPAVTGACLMISGELYEEMGGLRGVFIRGDYEDSDLCMRLREMGREAWYLPSAELYHLEGQSYPTAERALASDYNKWLHTHLWVGQLAEQEGERP